MVLKQILCCKSNVFALIEKQIEIASLKVFFAQIMLQQRADDQILQELALYCLMQIESNGQQAVRYH